MAPPCSRARWKKSTCAPSSTPNTTWASLSRKRSHCSGWPSKRSSRSTSNLSAAQRARSAGFPSAPEKPSERALPTPLGSLSRYSAKASLSPLDALSPERTFPKRASPRETPSKELGLRVWILTWVTAWERSSWSYEGSSAPSWRRLPRISTRQASSLLLAPRERVIP